MNAPRARKPNRRFNRSCTHLVAALAAAVCCGRSRAVADTWTWTGSASANWNNSSNWNHTSGSSGSGIPLNSVDTVVDFAGSTNTSPNQNIASPLLINSVGFNSGASFFTLGGFGLIFETSSTSVAPTLVQNSSNGELVNETLTFANNTTFSGSGVGTVEIADPINGAGALIDSAAAPLELFASNSYGGGTTLNGGQILFNNASAFASGTIAFNSGTLTATTTTSLANNFSNSSGSAINFQAQAGTTLTVDPSSALFGSLNFGSSGETGTVNFEPSSYSTFGGQIDVNGGTLLDGAGSLASVSGIYGVAIAQSATFNTGGNSESITDLTGAGTLALGTNSSATFTLETANFSGTITGSGKLVVAGGTAILSGANTYSGGTALNSGTIGVGNGSALGSAAVAVSGNADLYATGTFQTLANPISIASGKSLTIVNDPTTAQDLVLSGPISGSGSLVMSGTANLTLNGTNSFSGGTTINGGQILFDNNKSFGNGTITFNSGTLTATTTVTLPNNFFNNTGTAITFQAVPESTLTLSPSSTLFGSLNFGSSLDTGVVNLSLASSFSYFGGQINVNGGTVLDGDDSLSQILSSYNVSIASSATLNVNGNSTTIADLTGAGTLATGSNSSETFTLQAANFSGTISGSGKLITTGGTVILSGANTYSGGTTLGGGFLSAGNDTALGSQAVTVTGNTIISAAVGARTLANPISINSNKTLTVVSDPAGNHRLNLNGNISGSGALVMSGLGILALDGTNSYSGGTTLNSGQLLINSSNSLGNASGTLTLNGGTLASTANATENNTFSTETATAPVTFEAAAGTTLNLDGPDFLGNETLNFGSATDTGTVVFAPNGGFEPGFPIYNVNGGLLFDSFGNLAINLAGDTLTIAQIATVNLNGFSTGLADLTGAGTLVTGTTSAETLGLQEANFSGTITGGGRLAIAGGTVILSGANIYTGGTAISSGLIGAGNGSAFGSAAVAVSGSADLYAEGADESLSNPISIASGQSLTIVDDPTGAHNLSLTGNISGSGQLVVAGGTVTLSGTNTYSGGTTLNSGELVLSNNALANATGLLTLNAGTITAAGNSSINSQYSDPSPTGPITFQAVSGVTLTLGGFEALGSAPINFGSAADTGTVNISPGTWFNPSGTLNVNGGTLLDGDGALTDNISSCTLFIAQIGTVNLNGNSGTVQDLLGSGTLVTGTNSGQTLSIQAANFSGNVTGSGQLVVAGGTVTLTGTNTYSGGTALNSGELVINNNSSLGSTLGELTLNSGTITSTSNVSINNNFSDTGSSPVTLQAATGTTLTLGGADTLDTVNVLTFGSANAAGTVDFAPGFIFIIGGATNGELNVNGGTLLDGSGFLSFAITQERPTVSIAQSATLNFNGNNARIANLLGSGTVVTGSNVGNTVTLQAANFSGNITGAGQLQVANGTVALSGTNTYTGGTSVSSGELQIAAVSALPNSPVSVGPSGLLQLKSSIGPVTIPSLSITGSGAVDVTNNTLLINYGMAADPIASIASYLATGYAGGAWTGAGINSSAVAGLNASQSALIYGLGYADGADGIVNGLSAGEIEVLPTLAGDAKLQGNVNFGDFQLLAGNFGLAGGWDRGNFTYGSIVNFGDFQLLAQNFGANASALTAGEQSSLNNFAAQFGDRLVPNPNGPGFTMVSVPEPACGGILTVAACGALARRRRRQKEFRT